MASNRVGWWDVSGRPPFEREKNEMKNANSGPHAVQIVSSDLLFIALVLAPDLSRVDKSEGLKPCRFCFASPGVSFVCVGAVFVFFLMFHYHNIESGHAIK